MEIVGKDEKVATFNQYMTTLNTWGPETVHGKGEYVHFIIRAGSLILKMGRNWIK